MGEFYFKHKSLLRFFFVITFVAYVVSMFFYPFYKGVGSVSSKWIYVQDVWNNWQTFNVGVIALFSSVLAIETTIYSENKQRQRNFQAAKAFLPDGLSDLKSYYRSSADTYHNAEYFLSGRTNNLLSKDLNPPTAYKTIFVECIRYAEPELSQYLANILVLLQVHNSRLEYYRNNAFKQGFPAKGCLVEDVIRLAELDALTDKLFKFARGEAEFNQDKLTISDYQNSYLSLGICEDDYTIGEKCLKTSTEEYIHKKLKAD